MLLYPSLGDAGNHLTDLANILLGGLYTFIAYLEVAWVPLIVGFLLAGLITEFVSKERITRMLKKKRASSILFATAASSILGICPCTTLPLFASLKKRGAGIGASIVILVAGPALNPISLLLTISLLGFGVGIVRIIAAVSLSLIIGVLFSLLFDEKEDGEVKESLLRRANATSVVSLRERLIASARYSLDYAKSLLWLILLGVFVSGMLRELVSGENVLAFLSLGPVSYLLASVSGLMLFIVPPLEIPLARSFVDIGMNPGVILTFLLAAPTLCLPVLLVVYRVLASKRTLAYLLSVICISILFGLGMSFISSNLMFSSFSQATQVASELAGALKGVLVAVLIGAYIAAVYSHLHNQKKLRRNVL
jgi:uncharacterized membrane protein YraQ (UPF0718 family)